MPVVTPSARATTRVATNWAKIPAIVLLLASLTLIFRLFTSASFLVTRVSVGGTTLVSSAEVERVADVEFQNIFQLNTDALEARLRKEFGCIDQVSVICRLPNQVHITVREHEALVVWESISGMWWLDSQGQVLGKAHDPGETAIIHDRQGLVSDPEDYIVGVAWDMVSGLIRALPAAKDFEYTQAHGLVLSVTAAGWPVYLGHEGRAETKVMLMQELVDRLTRDGVDVMYIDLRDEKHPTYKAR
ncbi:MAG: FtsQ-type POTRA domain-containing protein [Anaerolineae bacterium]|nr:FtsQ-type POTRA domain-containing protein [Anaerolineae bacterium]